VQHRAEIDGLRAVVVPPDLQFHAGFPASSGGYVVVDVFFLISGYLITSILAKKMTERCFRSVVSVDACPSSLGVKSYFSPWSAGATFLR
jgi:peptidoglycan/LPS O-acetylase OafA/YrhL